MNSRPQISYYGMQLANLAMTELERMGFVYRSSAENIAWDRPAYARKLLCVCDHAMMDKMALDYTPEDYRLQLRTGYTVADPRGSEAELTREKIADFLNPHAYLRRAEWRGVVDEDLDMLCDLLRNSRSHFVNGNTSYARWQAEGTSLSIGTRV